MIPTLVRPPGKRSKRRHVMMRALAKCPDLLEVGHRPVPSCSTVKPAPLVGSLARAHAASGGLVTSIGLEAVMATEAAGSSF